MSWSSGSQHDEGKGHQDFAEQQLRYSPLYYSILYYYILFSCSDLSSAGGPAAGHAAAQWQEGAGAGDSSRKAAGRKMPGTVPGTGYPGG